MNNTELDFRLLKRLYAIHSPSGKEHRMMKYLAKFMSTIPGVKTTTDGYGNLYAVKGESETFPCLVAHTDQVQTIHSKDFMAIETRDIIFGYSAKNKRIEGIGGDDKNGVFIALEALKKYDCLKAVFFREEETGCRGSNNCHMDFFNDCRFVVQCDRRGDSDMIVNIGCSELCSAKFIQDINPEKWGFKPEHGMMTDVEALKDQGLSISAINLSCGYFNPHTDEEICDKQALRKTWRMVQHIIEDCTDVYPHEALYGSYYEDEYWEIENDINAILDQDPTITALDLYEMYQTNFPFLQFSDFERIVDDYRLIHDDEPIKNLNEDGKEEKLLGFQYPDRI